MLLIKIKLAADLNEKWEVLAEPIQTMLRKYGISDAYDQLKRTYKRIKIFHKKQLWNLRKD